MEPAEWAVVVDIAAVKSRTRLPDRQVDGHETWDELHTRRRVRIEGCDHVPLRMPLLARPRSRNLPCSQLLFDDSDHGSLAFSARKILWLLSVDIQ